MKWHASKNLKGQGLSWLKPPLLVALLFFSLVAFNLSLADEPILPNLEHPWDDNVDGRWGSSSAVPPGTHDPLILPLGGGLKIIVHLQPRAQKESLGGKKGSAPPEKNRSHVLISLR